MSFLDFIKLIMTLILLKTISYIYSNYVILNSNYHRRQYWLHQALLKLSRGWQIVYVRVWRTKIRAFLMLTYEKKHCNLFVHKHWLYFVLHLKFIKKTVHINILVSLCMCIKLIIIGLLYLVQTKKMSLHSEMIAKMIVKIMCDRTKKHSKWKMSKRYIILLTSRKVLFSVNSSLNWQQ